MFSYKPWRTDAYGQQAKKRSVSEARKSGLKQAIERWEAIGKIDEYWEIDIRSRFLHPLEHILSSPASQEGVDLRLKIVDFQSQYFYYSRTFVAP